MLNGDNAPGGTCAKAYAERVLAFVRRETYSLSEHAGDHYARGWAHAMQHVERWLLEQRTVQAMRELRDSVPVLSEAESDAEVHARALRRAVFDFRAASIALSREGRAG